MSMLYPYDNLYADKKVYFAGPQSHYPTWGIRELAAQKAIAEAWGVSTSRPGDQLEPDVSSITDPNAKADAIFADIVSKMNASDYIIADVEFFRGTQPDDGTAFDLGMAYARNLKSYSYFRDKRTNLFKNQSAVLDPTTGTVLDPQGRVLPEEDSAVNLMISCSSKVLQGDTFEVGIKQLFLDLEDDAKAIGAGETPTVNPITIPEGPPWKVYVAGTWVFENDWLDIAAQIRNLCIQYNLEPIFPAADEGPRPEFPNPWSYQSYIFNLHIGQLQSSNVIIADINPFQGYGVDSGTAFECGAAYMYGHRMYGYIDSLDPLVSKIPNVVKDDGKHYDMTGSVVEDYGYPASLRFASSMKIFEGDFETIIQQVALDLGAITE